MFCTDVTEAGVRGALRGRRTAVWANGTLIGPAPYLVPLLAACLTVESAAYQPDTRRFALQQRDPTPLLDCVLGNRGPLPLIIRMSGEVGPVSHPGPITVPARGTTRVRLQTYRRSTGVTVEVEALNALVAPDEPARFTLRIPPTDT